MQRIIGPLITVLALLGCSRPTAQRPCECLEGPGPSSRSSEVAIDAPTTEDEASLRRLLRVRQSVRSFSSRPLLREELLALLWAAQGITDRDAELRTAPSAGARYPLELYIVVESVEELEPGLYRYRPAESTIEPIGPTGHLARALAEASLGQSSLARAPATVVVAAEVSRTAARYGPRAERYVLMEVGHASQNLLLMATALGLGGCPIGAFEANEVQDLLELRVEPFYLIPVGSLQGS